MHRVKARSVTGKRNLRAEPMARFRDRGCTWAVSAIRVSVLFSSRWFANASLAVTGAPVGLITCRCRKQGASLFLFCDLRGLSSMIEGKGIGPEVRMFGIVARPARPG